MRSPHFDTQGAFDQMARLSPVEVEGVWPVNPLNAQDIAKAAGREEPNSGSRPLDEHIRPYGRGMHKVIDGLRVHAGFSYRIEHAVGRVVRRSEGFSNSQVSGRIGGDKIGKGAADIHGDS